MSSGSNKDHEYPQHGLRGRHTCAVMSVVCDATTEHVGVHILDGCGPCCQWKPCGGPWSVLLLAVRGREASFAVVSRTAVWSYRMRAIEGFCGNPSTITVSPHTRKRNSLDRNHWRKSFKIVIKMQQCTSSQLIVSGRDGVGGKDSVFFKGLATGQLLTMLPWVQGLYKWTGIVSPLLGKEQGWVTWHGKDGKQLGWDTSYEILK